MIAYSRLEVWISWRTTNLVFTLSVDICVESNRRITISGEFRPLHFRSIQSDSESLVNEFAECLCTSSLIWVERTHLCREFERKAGQFGSWETILAVVNKLPEDGVLRV